MSANQAVRDEANFTEILMPFSDPPWDPFRREAVMEKGGICLATPTYGDGWKLIAKASPQEKGSHSAEEVQVAEEIGWGLGSSLFG